MRSPLAPPLAARSVLFALAIALCALAAVGCRRPCESAANCKRTCSCLNRTTQARAECTMAFRCETADGYCETDFDELSCNEICARYDATATCGFQRCLVDAECVRRLTCPVLDGDGNPTTLNFDCTLNFVCDQDRELCEVASTLSPEQMCQQLCVQGG
jgi:hypothetical protein